MRNWLYDTGQRKSREFVIPVVCVGNLEVGGAGKSPMTEYLVRLFKPDYKLATLSRGYGRETKGFALASVQDTSTQVGDEPAQFKHKFPDVTVAVCEDRATGIDNLFNEGHNLIILDDGFQHRKVKPSFSVLLFDYSHLNDPRWVLPAGNYREGFSGRWRADVIVISKCPVGLSEDEMEMIYRGINPMPWQHLFFSTIAYQPLRALNGGQESHGIDADTTMFLLTGIANPQPLLNHLGNITQTIVHHKYPDHHPFSLKNIVKLADEFAACTAQKKLIVTTEKDAQRLVGQDIEKQLSTLPVFVLPIAVQFLGEGKAHFDKLITEHVREYTANHTIH